MPKRRKAPELTFQQHIADYLVLEHGYGAIRGSVLYVQRMHKILDRVGMKGVGALLDKRDPVATAEFIRENLLAKG